MTSTPSVPPSLMRMMPRGGEKEFVTVKRGENGFATVHACPIKSPQFYIDCVNIAAYFAFAAHDISRTLSNVLLENPVETREANPLSTLEGN